MKFLILEDEIPAYKKLILHMQSYLKRNFKHDWARSNREAKEYLNDNIYDLIIADIKLLDGKSIDLFDEVQLEIPIIFCSAYDQYLMHAFNTNGIAYLLKPYTQTQFFKAIEKYETLFKKGEYQILNQDTLNQLKIALQHPTKTYKKRFVIKKANGIQLVDTEDISVILANGDFCFIYDNKANRYTISTPLYTILESLDPRKFFKINRSEIVHISSIQSINNSSKNRLIIKVIGYDKSLRTTATTTALFRKWLE